MILKLFFGKDEKLKKRYDTPYLIKTMVDCPNCGNDSWTNISCITITDEYLKSMKENSSPYKYGADHPDWANIVRVGNFIMEFQCRKCNFVSPEICY